jgi:hypothetical protein
MFRCGKNSLYIRGNTAWCRWTEEICEVKNCSYATCIKRRLLPQGVCGETVKRRTIEKPPEETISSPIRLKGRALRKIGEKELY